MTPQGYHINVHMIQTETGCTCKRSSQECNGMQMAKQVFTRVSLFVALQMDKSQSPLSKSGTPSPSHRDALTPGAPGAPGAPGPSTSCLRLVSKAASSADPLGETHLLTAHTRAHTQKLR